MDNEQTFEEVATYLRATHMAKVIKRELILRREVAMVALVEATEERELWKQVGRIEVLDNLTYFFGN